MGFSVGTAGEKTICAITHCRKDTLYHHLARLYQLQLEWIGGKRMPELKNEIPTDSELREYFLEHFSSTVEGEMYAPPNRGVPELTAGCNRLIKKAGESIFASLQRLNQLERTDPFWRGTNRRTTVYKLIEFCDVVLK